MLFLTKDDLAEATKLQNSRLVTDCFGIEAFSLDGEPAQLAVLDDDGRVLEAGIGVAHGLWWLMLRVRNNFARGNGLLQLTYFRPSVFANAKLTATWRGVQAYTADGRAAQLAILDQHGRVLESGPQVARAAWWLMLDAEHQYAVENGHIKVLYEGPPTSDPSVIKRV